MLTMKKEKEIMYFAKTKVNALRKLLDSREVQEMYSDISSDNVEWEKFWVNMNNFTMEYNETRAELLSIPLKKSVKNLRMFKVAIEEISRKNKMGLYVKDTYPYELYEEYDEFDEEDEDYCLRICSPSMNRNIQKLRLMTYIEEEKINFLIHKVDHAKDKSLQKNIVSIKQLLSLGVDTILNLSYMKEKVIGRISTIKDDVMEIMIDSKPELITLSTIKIEDSWQVNGIEGDTPTNYLWNNGMRISKVS